MVGISTLAEASLPSGTKFLYPQDDSSPKYFTEGLDIFGFLLGDFMSLFSQEVLSYNGIFVGNLFAEPGGEMSSMYWISALIPS